MLKVTTSENHTYISIHVTSKKSKSLSWEVLQIIKDKFYKNLDFIEVYPKNSEIINKGNVRHLIHIRAFNCPKLPDLELPSDVKNFNIIVFNKGTIAF
jgi:hypothetical protein